MIWTGWPAARWLALQDAEGFTLGLGVVDEADRLEQAMTVRTPLPGLEGVTSLRFGAARWDLREPEGVVMTGPKLRDVETQPIQHQGQAMILLRDPLRLSETAIAVPQALAPLLGLMDGTRDEAALQAAFTIRMGVRLAPGLLPKLVADLDKAYLLDNERSAAAIAAALKAYREAPFRPMGSGRVRFFVPIRPRRRPSCRGT